MTLFAYSTQKGECVRLTIQIGAEKLDTEFPGLRHYLEHHGSVEIFRALYDQICGSHGPLRQAPTPTSFEKSDAADRAADHFLENLT